MIKIKNYVKIKLQHGKQGEAAEEQMRLKKQELQESDVSPNEYILKQREITKKWDDLELWFVVTALPLIELYHCIKFQVDIFNTFRVMRRK